MDRTARADSTESIVVTGIIAHAETATGWVVADTVVRPESGPAYEHALRLPFDLRLDDGSVVSVRTEGASVVREAAESFRGPWRELADRLAGLTPGFRPGPHLPVAVVVRGFEVGARVRVEGGVLEQRRAEGRGYREGSGQPRPALVEARRITTVHGPARDDRPAPEGPRASSSGSLGAALRAAAGLLFAGGLAGFVLLTPARSTFDAVLRSSWAAFALVLAWRWLAHWLGQPQVGQGGLAMRHWPSFATVRFGASRRTINGVYDLSSALALFFCAVALPWGLSTIAPELLDGPPSELDLFDMAAVVPPVAFTIGLLIDSHVATRTARRVARAILAAPRAKGAGWSCVEGAIGAEGWSHTIDLREQRQHRTTILHVVDVSRGPSEVELRTSAGPLRLRLDGATWGTTEWTVARTGSSSRRLELRASPGARVLVVGDLAAATAGASGPESLLVFTSGGRDPRVTLRVLSWSHRAFWFAPVLATAAVLARWLL